MTTPPSTASAAAPRPCPTCLGTGVVVVKAEGQPDVSRTCPGCRGAKVLAGGLSTK